MPRPPKMRWIQAGPRATLFKPRGVPAHMLETVVLGLDELEAIRLADLEGLYHEQAATRMRISRPTFGRLLAQARGKVADALLHGKALAFAGGVVSLGVAGVLECGGCGRSWQVPAHSQLPSVCAECGSEQLGGLRPAPHTGPPGVVPSPGVEGLPVQPGVAAPPEAALPLPAPAGWGRGRRGHGPGGRRGPHGGSGGAGGPGWRGRG